MTRSQLKAVNDIIFLQIISFSDKTYAAEFENPNEFPERVFRLNIKSLQTRIVNIKDRGLETDEEERALVALENIRDEKGKG